MLFRPILVLIVHLAFVGKLLADQGGYFQDLRPEILQVPVYEPEGDALGLRMSFAEYAVHNPEAARHLEGRVIHTVDLVFTRYPWKLDTWEVNYDSLMEHRYAKLKELVPHAFGHREVSWRIFLQTDCQDLATAKTFFHGFYISHGPASAPSTESPAPTEEQESSLPLPTPRYDSLELQEELDRALKLITGDKEFYDSTALEILDRHPEWGDLVLVSDWTASMYRHGAYLIRHFRQGPEKDRVKGYVFFNDGDGKYDEEKVVGLTGGIYVAPANESDAVMTAVRKVLLGGNGGDHRENDLEALIVAQEKFPEIPELVLIADNSGPVRDLALLEYIDRPVRIVLCGVYHDNIEPDYFTLAYRSGGSLHIRGEDFEDFGHLPLGRQFQLGDYEYRLKNGRFIKRKMR